jgi:hypothetical protein
MTHDNPSSTQSLLPITFGYIHVIKCASYFYVANCLSNYPEEIQKKAGLIIGEKCIEDFAKKRIEGRQCFTNPLIGYLMKQLKLSENNNDEMKKTLAGLCRKLDK